VRVRNTEPARLDFVPEVLHGFTKETAIGQEECHSRIAQQAQDAVNIVETQWG